MAERAIADRQSAAAPLNVLLVRLRQIGDVVFTTPAVSLIRRRFPDARISYLVEPPGAPVVAGNPHLDRVIVAPRGRGAAGFLRDLSLGARLRRERYDVAIDFHGGPRASLLTWLSGAPMRIGYEVAGRAWMYTRRVARPRALRARHSVENQCDLLEPLGIEAPDPERSPIEIPVDAAAAARVDARLAGAGVAADARLIVVHVSAGNPFRRWPLESFARTAADLIRADPKACIVFTSGPSERLVLDRVITLAREQLPPPLGSRIPSCGDFSLAELRALVERAALYVGGDSGPIHVASASRIPIVSLYGPTLPARSAPWRSAQFASAAVETAGLECRPCDQRVCVHGDFRCLTRITPDDVVGAARRLLAANAGGQNG